VKISIHEARENLTKYIEMAQRGVEITINVNNLPACKMVGIHQATTKRFGLLRGKATIPDHFDHQDQATLEMFYEYDDRYLTL
jgi:prevent-host-death family protein